MYHFSIFGSFREDVKITLIAFEQNKKLGVKALNSEYIKGTWFNFAIDVSTVFNKPLL